MNRYRHSTFEQRVEWLREHPRMLWRKYDREGVSNMWKLLVDAMKHDGLIAPSTYWLDVKLWPEIDAARGIEVARTK